jgi:hypothetical protein
VNTMSVTNASRLRRHRLPTDGKDFFFRALMAQLAELVFLLSAKTSFVRSKR